MIKKYLCGALICLLLLTANFLTASAQTKTASAEQTAQVKAAVLKRGTGENKRVKLKKLDGTKLKGYVSQAGEDSFTLVDSETKQPIVVAYNDVEKIGNRQSRGDKIALIAIGSAAAVAGIIVLSFVVRRCQNEGGC